MSSKREKGAPGGRCFLITPIGARGSPTRKHADWVYRFLRTVCDDRSIELDRADTMAGSPMITSRIFEAIRSSKFCVADLTALNPNVLYELGIRHSLNLPVVHIALEGTDLPFDNAQHDTIFFDVTSSDSMDELAANVASQFDRMSSAGYVVSNPFTAALGALELRQSHDPRDQIISALEERLTALEHGRAPTTRRRNQLELLREVIQHFHASPSGQGNVNVALVRGAVEEIPPWQETVAQELVNDLLISDGISNRTELINEIGRKFPTVMPF